MTDIQSIIATLPFDKAPYFPYVYSEEQIAELEARIGHRFPDDFRWYLATIGWLKLDCGKANFLIRSGEFLFNARFQDLENQVFAAENYDKFLVGPEGGLLPGNVRDYFPFGKVDAFGNPSPSFQLVICLDGADRGSIWTVRPIGLYGDQKPSHTVKLCESFADFLLLLAPDEELGAIATANNDALFKRLFAEYAASTPNRPTLAADPVELAQRFFKEPERIVFDGARNVEFQFLEHGQYQENLQDFAKSADWYATELLSNQLFAPPRIERRDIAFGAPQPYDRSYEFIDDNRGYFLLPVQSIVGDGGTLKEEFFVHRTAAGWTLLRRMNAEIGDVRVKNVGTFAFSNACWTLKKKVTPAWSERAVELNMPGGEDALTAARIAFIKEIVANAGFRQVFEAHVFRLYTERFYPEFLAMDDDEKADWIDDYPEIGGPGEIWRLFGKKATIYVDGDNCFSFNIDAGYDPEHGLDVKVADWNIV